MHFERFQLMIPAEEKNVIVLIPFKMLMLVESVHCPVDFFANQDQQSMLTPDQIKSVFRFNEICEKNQPPVTEFSVTKAKIAVRNKQ